MMFNNTGKNVSSHHPTTAATTQRTAAVPYLMPHYHHHHHHQEVRHPVAISFSPPPSLLPLSVSGIGGGDDDDDDFPRRDERFPQWSNLEIRDFIEIRAQFDLEFTTAKRETHLWGMVANGMRQKGYKRTPDQCKCKWKNLVSRYKEHEASDVDNSRQCPFFDELHAVFTSRVNQMQPPQLNVAGTAFTKASKTLTFASEDQSHEEFSQDQSHEEGTEVQQSAKTRIAPKRKTIKEKRPKIVENENYPNKNHNILDSLHEMMCNFTAQQQRIDVHWKESVEKHAVERELFEDEWRKRMENLERERLVKEKAWREREEQRRSREESRAEKRDVLLTMLLNKLIRDESHL